MCPKTESRLQRVRNPSYSIIDMTNQLKHHKKYTEFAEPYQLVLPLNLEDLILDDLKTCIYRENRELPVNEIFTLCGCLPDRNKDTRFAEDSDAIFMHMKDDHIRNEKRSFKQDIYQ